MGARPLLERAYAACSLPTFSNLLGVVELTSALRSPVRAAPRPVGAALAAGTFAITSTFLITRPSCEQSLGGIPALSPAGGLLIKDLALLGIAPTVVGRAAARIVDGHELP